MDLSMSNSSKFGPHSCTHTYLWTRNLEMNNEFFEQKDSEKLVMHKIAWYTSTQKV